MMLIALLLTCLCSPTHAAGGNLLSLLSLLQSVRQQLVPVGDVQIAGSSSPSSTPSDSAPPYQSTCTGLLPRARTVLLQALQASYAIQEGEVDWGLTGQQGEQSHCASIRQGGCSLSDPSRCRVRTGFA